MKKINPYLGFNDLPFVLIGLPLVGFLLPQLFFGVIPWENWDLFRLEWVESSVFTAVFWIFFRSAMLWLRKRYPGFDQSARRLWLLLLLSIPAVPLFNVLIHAGLSFVLEDERHDPGLYKGLLTTYFLSFAIMAVYEAVYYYSRLKQSIALREEAKRAQVRSELEGLRNQVNPHFLFNSLNTLMHIVTEDPELARRFLQRMSKVYRYVLESRGAPLIPLAEELEFIDAYLFLQRERFRGNLIVDIRVDPIFHQHKIVSLSLQILFENAIKHNVISKKHKLRIAMYVDEHLQLVVTNNLQPKQQVLHSTRVGLDNIRKRYQYFTERAITVQAGEKDFTVTIPLIHPQKTTEHARADY